MTNASVPGVTVLVSCFNAGKWMREAIDSVLTQSFTDLELLLVDDGSTDETWDIIESYRAIDSRVVGLRKANSGLADSLNAGLRMARGQWVARLDADDRCEPTRLEQQVRFVRSNKDVVLLGTGFVEVDAAGAAIRTHRYPTSHRALVWHLEHLSGFFPHSSAFFRLDAARKAGWYNVRFRRAQDWRLWLDLSRQGRIASLRQPLVRIRKHAEQISLTSGGTRQVYDATAGTVGHLLSKAGHRDPCWAEDEGEWLDYLAWIESKVRQSGFLERQNSWNEARSRLLSTPPGWRRGLAFARQLMSSGYAFAQLSEHLFGLTLPKRLMHDWIEECAAS